MKPRMSDDDDDMMTWLPNMILPGLAMARSIGDDIAASVGVHATPEIMTYELTKRDKFMVIASDGVWEFLSNEQVLSLSFPCRFGCPGTQKTPLCDRGVCLCAIASGRLAAWMF